MSQWTYVTATFQADDFGNTSDRGELTSMLERAIGKYPPITGSEGNANVIIAVNPGNNWSMTGFKGGVDKEGQSRFTVTIHGDLRDKDAEETYKELREFYRYICSNFWVRDSSWQIHSHDRILSGGTTCDYWHETNQAILWDRENGGYVPQTPEVRFGTLKEEKEGK